MTSPCKIMLGFEPSSRLQGAEPEPSAAGPRSRFCHTSHTTRLLPDRSRQASRRPTRVNRPGFNEAPPRNPGRFIPSQVVPPGSEVDRERGPLIDCGHVGPKFRPLLSGFDIGAWTVECDLDSGLCVVVALDRVCEPMHRLGLWFSVPPKVGWSGGSSGSARMNQQVAECDMTAFG